MSQKKDSKEKSSQNGKAVKIKKLFATFSVIAARNVSVTYWGPLTARRQ
jgi:hypothetical protein